MSCAVCRDGLRSDSANMGSEKIYFLCLYEDERGIFKRHIGFQS